MNDTIFDKKIIRDMDTWDQAFETWLDKHGKHTRRAYRQGWNDFYVCINKAPWEVIRSDVTIWLESLQERGLADSTIAQRLAAISSFFAFAQEYTVSNPNGDRILHHSNPAKVIKRPQVTSYEKAVYLTPAQVRAFFRVIPQSTKHGLRNYALFLFFVATGRRNGEIRKLRWGDFRVDGNKTLYRWYGKADENWDECPKEVWQAITRYLRVVGRLDKIRPTDYIFTALTDVAERFDHVGDDYDPKSQPISSTTVGKIFKMYARMAGIETEDLRVHSLRHTTTMVLRAIGADSREIQDRLGHSTRNTTDCCISALKKGQTAEWMKIQDYLGI